MPGVPAAGGVAATLRCLGGAATVEADRSTGPERSTKPAPRPGRSARVGFPPRDAARHLPSSDLRPALSRWKQDPPGDPPERPPHPGAADRRLPGPGTPTVRGHRGVRPPGNPFSAPVASPHARDRRRSRRLHRPLGQIRGQRARQLPDLPLGALRSPGSPAARPRRRCRRRQRLRLRPRGHPPRRPRRRRPGLHRPLQARLLHPGSQAGQRDPGTEGRRGPLRPRAAASEDPHRHRPPRHRPLGPGHARRPRPGRALRPQPAPGRGQPAAAHHVRHRPHLRALRRLLPPRSHLHALPGSRPPPDPLRRTRRREGPEDPRPRVDRPPRARPRPPQRRRHPRHRRPPRRALPLAGKEGARTPKWSPTS